MLHSRLLSVSSKGQYAVFRQAFTRPRHLVDKTKRRAENTNPDSSSRSADRKQSLRVCLPTDRVGWSGKETPVSDAAQKYPLWQNHYLQAMAETRTELVKSKISAAEQVVSLRLGNWQAPQTSMRNR
jgi:hypothetical protein